MNIEELKNKIIEEGLVSVKKTEKGPQRRGGVAGFELCRDLHTPEDFERELENRRKKEFEILSSRPDLSEEQVQSYWEERYKTLQVEYVFNILKVGWNYPTISARAGLRYADLVGVKEE